MATAKFDVAIIGGGPAGLSAAMGLSRVRRNIVLFDSREYRNAPSPQMHNVVANDGRDNSDFRKEARSQISAYGSTHFVFEEVTSIRGDFVLTTSSGADWSAQKVIFAAGIRDELPPISGLAALWKAGWIHHCIYCHGYERRDRKLAVLGIGHGSLHGLFGSATLNERITLLKNIASNDVNRPIEDKVAKRLEKLNVQIEDRIISSVAENSRGDGIEVCFEGGFIAEYDAMLHLPDSKVSPTLRGLLESLGVPFGEGQMAGQEVVQVTDQFGRTARRGVYASGDLGLLPARSIPGAMFTGGMAAAAAHADLIEDEN
jgi:thioredoxin reductase